MEYQAVPRTHELCGVTVAATLFGPRCVTRVCPGVSGHACACVSRVCAHARGGVPY